MSLFPTNLCIVVLQSFDIFYDSGDVMNLEA